MRRVGLILLALGLLGFFFASSQASRYAAAGETGTAEAARAERRRHAWDEGRWLLLGTAVMGLVFTVLPGKSA